MLRLNDFTELQYQRQFPGVSGYDIQHKQEFDIGKHKMRMGINKQVSLGHLSVNVPFRGSLCYCHVLWEVCHHVIPEKTQFCLNAPPYSTLLACGISLGGC